MESDQELLRQFAEAGQQTAFAEVVRRHTDFVYSTALRLVAGDSHLAQDVSQTVFTALANKATALSRHERLLGWLHTATRYTASDAVRRERRRRTREQEASTMNDHAPTTEPDWAQLQPLLDDAVGRLGMQDREAVLLRFFHNKSHREVGAVLGLSETLVRKRVDRALEKLRAILSRRGVTTTSALLATAITTHSVHAAPTGLATALGQASLHHAAKAGLIAAWWHGFMSSKLKTSLAATSLLLLATIPLTVVWRHAANMNALNADLVRTNAALEQSLVRLRAGLGKARDGATLAGAVAKAPADGADYVPVNLAAIKNLPFSIYGKDYILDRNTAQLLGLSPNEIRGVQHVLDNLQQRALAYEKANLRQIDPVSITDEDVLKLLSKNPGKLSAYAVRPMTDSELAALQKWYLDSMTQVTGSDRAQIMFEKVVAGQMPSPYAISMNEWLTPGMQRRIIFTDFTGPNGTPETAAWVFNGNLGQNDGGDRAYPESWAPLLKGLRPTFPTNLAGQIESNLHAIMAAAKKYMLFNNVDQVSYQQLTEGPGAILPKLTPIGGENYDKIVVKQNEMIYVRYPGGGYVEYNDY